MRGASNPDGRTAAPGLLRFARNDGQGIGSLVSACRLTAANQDEIACAMLSLARASEGESEDIDPAHLLDVLEGLAPARRREFATDADVAATFARFDP